MDTYIVLFLAAVVALYVPVLGWCWWQRRKEDARDPYAEPWS
jgi:predicted negative regulator of RcsB-dependent stress response